jgi:hypothetical protein
MAIFVDVSDVDLDRRMVFGGDETVGGGTKVERKWRVEYHLRGTYRSTTFP